MAESRSELLKRIEERVIRKDLPEFRPGDTVKVFAKVVEGTKERLQAYEGVVLKRHRRSLPGATFTVRKVSFNNISVERTFRLHSPRIDRIEIVSRGRVRRSRLYYLRPLRGKASRIKRRMDYQSGAAESSSTQEG